MSKDNLTPRDMEVLALAWQCMESEPKVDYDKLAELAGYTRSSASVIFGNIRRKLKKLAANGPSGTSQNTHRKATPVKASKSSTKRKADDGATPSRKPKTNKKSAGSFFNDEDEDENEEYAEYKVYLGESNIIDQEAKTFFNENENQTVIKKEKDVHDGMKEDLESAFL